MHGWMTRYSKWGQMLAGQGYFVLMPNYRASIGRGVAYSKANHGDLGGREFEDVVDGIDYLIEQGLVDKGRVGCGGGSYGGYFSGIAATKWSQRFAASVVFAGPSSQYSKIGTTDTTWENAYVHYNLPEWWKHHEKIWSFSPVAYVENAQTPTLICHGENDRRVPVGQGWELFRNIKSKGGIPVEFVIYPRAGHGLRESRRAIAWFNKYLKGE
jgi:dipeptidyl aminopeptidase/acylaminoacyl peptidase